MSRRHRLLIGLGLGVLAAGLAGVVVLLSQPETFPVRCDRIREGMTIEEVVAIMKPYEAETSPSESDLHSIMEVGHFLESRRNDTGGNVYAIWREGPGRIVVVFDGEDRVVSIVLENIERKSLLDPLRALLRRLGL